MAIKFDDSQLVTINQRVKNVDMNLKNLISNIITNCDNITNNLEQSSELAPMLSEIKETVTNIKLNIEKNLTKLTEWLDKQINDYNFSTEEAEQKITNVLAHLYSWVNDITF